MAYVDQAKKKALTPAIKAVLKKFGMTGSISIRHQSCLVVSVTNGKLDVNKTFGRDNVLVHSAPIPTDDELMNQFQQELFEAMRGDDWFDESDSQTDYFHLSHYCQVHLGKWNKPYVMA